VNHDVIVFLQGISATAAWASGLLFFRFWRQSHDSLFAFFGSAFWLLAISWALLALFSPTEEARPYVYLVRLVAVALLIVGMVVKNRSFGIPGR
jgi:hypothetical protein